MYIYACLIYYLCILTKSLYTDLPAFLKRIRKFTDVPVAVGCATHTHSHTHTQTHTHTHTHTHIHTPNEILALQVKHASK